MLLSSCSATPLAVPQEVMRHVVRVESAGNPYAIGVVRGSLARQPRKLDEAVATAKMLEEKGFNFSLGLAQVNRYNLQKYDLGSYEKAFEPCANLVAGSRILKECFDRSQDWGKAFSWYYSGNFTTGFRHGYVQKVVASMRAAAPAAGAASASALAIPVIPNAPAAKSRAPRGIVQQTDPRLAVGRVSRVGVALAEATQVQPGTQQAVPFVAAPAQQQPATQAQTAPSAPVAGPSSAAPAPARDSGFVF